MVLFPHWPAGYSEVQSRYLETLIHAKACGNVGVCIKRADLSVKVSRTPDGCFYLACRMQVCGTLADTIFFSLLFFLSRRQLIASWRPYQPGTLSLAAQLGYRGQHHRQWDKELQWLQASPEEKCYKVQATLHICGFVCHRYCLLPKLKSLL